MQFIADGYKLLQLYYWNGINQEHYMHHLPRRNPPGGTLWNFSLLRQHLNKFSLNKNLSAGIKRSEISLPPSSARRPLEECDSPCTVATKPLLPAFFSFLFFHHLQLLFSSFLKAKTHRGSEKFHSIYWTSK